MGDSEKISEDQDQHQIQVHLRSVGEAPALKKPKMKIDGKKDFIKIEGFLRKQLRYDGQLFLYCGSGFSPTPDQSIQDLFDCFKTGNELFVYYGYKEAWG